MGYNGRDFKNCNWVFERTVSLPIFPGMSEQEIDYVIDAALEVVRKKRR
jgi:dTDP-4-amino-4,6-dideoxygalactose transaminase